MPRNAAKAAKLPPSAPSAKYTEPANSALKYAWISGIISLVFIVPVLLAESIKSTQLMNPGFFIFYSLTYVLSAVFYVLFMWGFALTGKRLNNSLLVVSSWLLIALYVLITSSIIFYSYALDYAPDFLMSTVNGFTVLFLGGIFSIIFGISLLKLKDKFGSIATLAGILNIVAGVLFILIFPSFIGLFLLIPIAILEILILHRAAKEL